VWNPKGMEMVKHEIEEYAVAHTTVPSPAVAALRSETDSNMPIPEMAGGLVESRLLEALVTATRATRVLEIGTFTGVTALSIAERLPAGGIVVTLEVDEEHAAIARRHFDASPVRDRIELVVGNALEIVQTLDGPFDVVFIDAWKADYLAYYEAVLPKLADHGVIVADNVLREGSVLDPAPGDEGAIALVAFADRVQADDRVDNAMLTVADGLLLIWKRRS
jgi:caffeoyl-CoA O-methyltransferase